MTTTRTDNTTPTIMTPAPLARLLLALFVLLAGAACEVKLDQKVINADGVTTPDSDTSGGDAGETDTTDKDGASEDGGGINPCDPKLNPCRVDGVCADNPNEHACDPDAEDDEETGKWTCIYEGISDFQEVETHCDGLDNDCDGETDEGIVDTEASDCKQDGVCAEGVVAICNPEAEGESERWICDYRDVLGYELIETSCDGLDNDCDGDTDADDADVTPALATCDKIDGVCYFIPPEAITCDGEAGEWVCDYTQIPGYEEAETLCDGLDNDCDGQVDGQVVGEDESISIDPAWQEVDGANAGCVAEGVCGSCDGETCATVVTATCGEAGAWTCHYDQVNGYEPTEWRCDGYDNDCDGSTDEDLAAVPISVLPDYIPNIPCRTAKPGVCAALKTVNCVQDAGSQAWSYRCAYDELPGYEEGSETLCDQLDNDCDGKTDGDDPDLQDRPPEMAGCADALGQCAGYVVAACSVGQWLCAISSFPAPSSYEPGGETSCDGLDNDCDGETDEGLFVTPTTNPALLSQQCPEATKGVCAGETYAYCDSSSGFPAWTCVHTSPNYEEGKELSCDGLDNDCSGFADEYSNFQSLTEAERSALCPGKGVCAGHSALIDGCVDGEALCVFQGMTAGDGYQAVETLCDGLDNDCDGAIDSDDPDFSSLTPAQIAIHCPGEGICADAGVSPVFTCGLGVASCAYPGVSGLQWPDETSCDGLDNDCDGLTDEGMSEEDTEGVCAAGEGVCAFVTPVRSCDTGAWVCDYSAATGYEAEETACDGFDNDCDGLVDEGLVQELSEGCAQVGVCAEAGGVDAECVAGQWVCAYDQVAGWVDEEGGNEAFCDGKDNDCDGLVDDGVCGGLGSICGQPADCQGDNGTPGATCTDNIYGDKSFCVEGVGFCAYSENDVWAEQVDHGTKRCFNDTLFSTCYTSEWQTPEACPLDAPWCTGLLPNNPCTLCKPGMRQCNGETKVRVCTVDGSNYEDDVPCHDSEYCAGEGMCLSDDEYRVNTFTTDDQFEPDMDYHPVKGFVVVWSSQGQDGDDGGIFGQRLSPDGRRTGAEFAVNIFTGSDQGEPAVAFKPDGSFVVVWRSQHDILNGADIFMRSFAADGSAIDAEETRVNTFTPKTQEQPDVAVNAAGDVIVVYKSKEIESNLGCSVDVCGAGIGARIFRADALEVDEFVANVDTYNDTQAYPAVAALVSGDFVITYMSDKKDGSSYGIFVTRFDAYGDAQTQEVPVNLVTDGPQVNPAITALPNGNFVVGWFNREQADLGAVYRVKGRLFGSTGSPMDDGFDVSPVDGNAAYASGLSIAGFPDAWMAFVWEEKSGSDSNVTAQVLTDGLAQGSGFQANEPNGVQGSPVAAGTDLWTVMSIWAGPDDTGEGTEIHARQQPRP